MIQAEEETIETQIQTSTHRTAPSDDDEESKWHELGMCRRRSLQL